MIWDTAGQERYNSIISTYYRHSNGVFLFFDLNNTNSYEDIRYWLDEVICFLKSGLIYVIGNKNDLEIKVNKYDIMEFIEKEYKNYNIYYKEVSIKNNIPDVNDIYSEFLINLYRIQNKKKVIHNNTTIRLKNKLKKKSKCCFI